MKFKFRDIYNYFKEKKTYFLIFITILLIVIDQLSKYFILRFQPNFKVLFFNIYLIKNTGAAFGILSNNSFILGIFSLIISILLIAYIIKSKEFTLQLILSLLLAGTIGNMIDRLFRNYVIDFIGTTFWPSFNVADSLITISGVLIIIYLVKEEIEKRKNKSDKKK